MVQLKTTKWNPGQNKPLSLCQLHHFMNIISRSDVIRNFLGVDWLSGSHLTRHLLEMFCQPNHLYLMVRQGWGAILSSLGCAHSPAPQTHHAVFHHALGKSHYKAFFKWQHLSWRVWVWLDLSQNQYIHSVHLQDKKKNERHSSTTELKPKTALFIFKRRFFFLSFFLLKYDLTSTEPTQFIGTEIITSV